MKDTKQNDAARESSFQLKNTRKILIVQTIFIIRSQNQWTDAIAIRKTLNKSVNFLFWLPQNNNKRKHYPLATNPNTPALQNELEHIPKMPCSPERKKKCCKWIYIDNCCQAMQLWVHLIVFVMSFCFSKVSTKQCMSCIIRKKKKTFPS